MKSIGLAACCLWTVLCLAAGDAPVTAIKDVKIVTAPGQVIEKGHLVIRDGLIESVSAEADIPADATVIEAKEGWVVYPAFIDAASFLGLKESEEGGNTPSGIGDIIASLAAPREAPTGVPHELPKIKPEYQVVHNLKPDTGKVSKHHQMGFATVQTMPRGGIMRGQSAVINLKPGDNWSMVLDPQFAQVIALETGGFIGNDYPGSRMGAVAAFRQAFLDAQRYRTWMERYDANPRMPRPPFKSSTQPMIDVLAGETPVVFVAQGNLSVDRFASLAEEFGITNAMYLATGREWRALSRLKASNMPVLLPLDYPKKPNVDNDEEAANQPMRVLQDYLAGPRFPAMLEEAEVPFALVTIKGASKFTKSLAQAVEEGLSQDAALAALTTTPAKLMGLDNQLGTLEAGKIANLIVVNGDLFSDKPDFRYVFVDGVAKKFDEKQSAGGDPNAVEDPVGTWEITITVMGQGSDANWYISKEGEGFKGYSESEQAGRTDFNSVTLEGNLLTINTPTPTPLGDLELELVIKGDDITGTKDVEVPQMGQSITINIKGKRIDKDPGGGR